ncbi:MULTISPECIES: cytochrome b [unclassified Alishewanella]|uniref:cytochrome b n=1 Tax=unclassified Alishewanella TaxID=2628974 RepID=UPI00404388F5
MLKNSQHHYGLISVLLHWLMAFMVIGLFSLGVWMVDLTYYSKWYRIAPDWHKSVGMLLAVLWCIRLLWRLFSQQPKSIASHRAWQRLLSGVVQAYLYLAMALMVLSGYLISTEDGRAISVFGWFDVPSLGALFNHQADIAGLVHEYVAYSLIAFASIHGLAALKHHVIDKDQTLSRMLGRKL